jgi:hypothetical protein
MRILEPRVPLTWNAELVAYLLDHTSHRVVSIVGAYLAIQLARVEVRRLIGEHGAAFAFVRHAVSDGQIEKMTNSKTKMMGVDVGATGGRKSGEKERRRMEHTLSGEGRGGRVRRVG